MSKYPPRLIRLMAAFYNGKPEKVGSSIYNYRRRKAVGGPDWEGERAQFARLVRIAFEGRHKERLRS